MKPPRRVGSSGPASAGRRAAAAALAWLLVLTGSAALAQESGAPEPQAAAGIDKTDPFKPFIVKQKAAEEERDSRPRTYLETLDLAQLDLIAVVAGPEGRWAMVRDAKGVGYVIREGTLIGTRDGVVHQIRESEVVIREKHRDFRGQLTVEEVLKSLPKP